MRLSRPRETFPQVFSAKTLRRARIFFKRAAHDELRVCNWHIKEKYEGKTGDGVERKLFLTVRPFLKTMSDV